MVELKNAEIKKGGNRYMIPIPKSLVEETDVLKLGKKYRVVLQEVKPEISDNAEAENYSQFSWQFPSLFQSKQIPTF